MNGTVPSGSPERVRHYRIESQLGFGELGIVYRAWDERLERWVALKQAVAGDEEARERFRKGARAVAGLSHPSLARIYDFVYADEGDWIVMEFFEGRTLRAFLDGGPLDPVQALPVVRQIAEGLAAIHARDIILLTLRPESVLVSGDGGARILDFGLARLLDTGGEDNPVLDSGAVRGAMGAMSPEQALDRPVDHRSDLFSFGTLLYEAITGRSPFAGASDVQTLQRLCSRRQESAWRVNAKVPVELSGLIDKLLEKDPGDRPQNAREVVAALQEIENGQEPRSGTVRLRFPASEDLTDAAGYFETELSDSQLVSLKTLLVTDLVGSTQLVGDLGDSRAAEVLAHHDRLARDLINRFQGREIDKTDGFLLLFRRPVDAVKFALEYHLQLADLSDQSGVELKARVGIHLGEVILHENLPQDVLRGAKPLEVQGLAKPIAARAMGLAEGGQTLLTRAAFDLVRRAVDEDEFDGHKLRWLAHDEYRFKGVEDGLPIFEVGLDGVSPLRAPADTEKARRLVAGAARGSGIRRLPPQLLLGIATVLLAAVVVLIVWTSRSPMRVMEARPAIAVLGFKNLSGRPELAWLSTALSELFSTDLATGGELRLIPGESISRMKLELSLPDVDTLGGETLGAIAQNLGTDYVLLGSYLPVSVGPNTKFRLLLRLQDTRLVENIIALSDSGTEAELFEVVSRTGAKLRERLKVEELSAAEAEAVRATLSASPEANRLYSEGLEKLRGFDALEARDRLRRAVEIEPGFALAHAALSEAWRALGYDGEALASARSGFEQAEDLPREQRLSIQGRFYEADSRWQEAVDTFRTLWDEFPDDIGYGLRLAEVQVNAGRGEQALATTRELRRLPMPARDDPRIDLAAANAAYSLSDYQGMVEATTAAEEKGQAQSATVLVAEALYLRGRALRRRGRIEPAIEVFEKARTIFTRVGDRGKVAQALTSIAVLSKLEGDLTGAEELYRQALSIHRETGNRKETSRLLNNLAILIQERGDPAAASPMLEEAVKITREDGRQADKAGYQGALAQLRLAQGDLKAARELAEQALPVFMESSNRGPLAWIHYALGKILFASGEMTRARSELEAARGICEAIGNRHLAGRVRSTQGELLLAAGDLAGAERALDEASAIRTELGEKGTLAQTQLIRARLLLETGEASQAEALLREASSELRKQARRDDEISANNLLARALLVRGQLAKARDVGDRARLKARDSQDPAVRMSVVITEARLLAAAGDFTPALSDLDQALAEATTLGFVGLAFEARLALGEIEIAALAAGQGAGRDGRARLTAVAEEAAVAGFGLIARAAAAAP